MLNQFTRYSWQKTHVQTTISIKWTERFLCTLSSAHSCTDQWVLEQEQERVRVREREQKMCILYRMAYTKPVCLLNYRHMKTPRIQTAQNPYKVFMVTNSMCWWWLKRIQRPKPKIVHVLGTVAFVVVVIDANALVECKIKCMRGGRVCGKDKFKNSPELFSRYETIAFHKYFDTKCFSCKLIYGYNLFNTINSHMKRCDKNLPLEYLRW